MQIIVNVLFLNVYGVLNEYENSISKIVYNNICFKWYNFIYLTIFINYVKIVKKQKIMPELSRFQGMIIKLFFFDS